MPTYRVRKTCKGTTPWHAFWAVQTALDAAIACPTHPAAATQDFCVENEEA